MINTFTKTSLRGFTLIELLVVIAIIGLLSTAIMGPVQTGLKKGRDTRKISDISQIQGALLQYAGDNNGKYPDWLAVPATVASTTLASTTPTYMAPASNMLGSVPVAGLKLPAARDRFMYVIYKDTAGNVVSYHLGVALENQNASLQGDADCGNGAANAPLAGNVLCGTGVATLATDLFYYNWVDSGAGYPMGTSINTDFGGAGTKENANDVCSADLTTCIFDVTPN